MNTVTSFIIIIILFIIIYRLKLGLRFRNLINKFPGKDGHPILGDAWDFTTDAVHNFRLFREYNKLFPSVYRIWFVFNIAVVVINTPEHAEVVLSNPKYIKKSMLYKFMKPWLKTGLLTSTGTKWFQRRKLLVPAFHFNVLKQLIEPFAEHNKCLIEKLKKQCHQNKINIMPIISQTALNLICDTSMGVQLDSNNKNQIEYSEAIHKFNEILRTRIVTPWYITDFIFRLSSLYKCQTKILKALHNFTNEIIIKKETMSHVEKFEENITYSKKGSPMLELLLNAKKNLQIDDEGIREEVDTFTFEGHDTVSMALSFALLVLANEQECQEKIIVELNQIFGKSNRDATLQDLQNMPYLEMCLKECLRLFPSVPMISREAEEDIRLDNNLIIPVGSLIHIQIYDIHRNKAHFPNPEKFIPERFSPENCRQRHPFAFIPFSAGPRNCIGQKYAMLELKSIVSCILRNFKMKPVERISDVILYSDMVLRPKDDIHIKFIPRIKNSN